MAAERTLPQLPNSNNLHVSKHGILTVSGYGISVRVDRGHLFVEDGIAANRQQVRLPRVGHGLKRLVVIGSDGMVSLAALRWLADQDAAFVMLERDGTVLLTTGPVRPSDVRLRRAQATALQNETALYITRELMGQKLAGQEMVARKKLLDTRTADVIGEFRKSVASAETIEAVLQLESLGASEYWAAWRGLSIMFPKADLPRVPDHWRTFVTRKSVLSGSQRLATDPANAMLNYLYAVLESETRLAVAALGLDPGLGFWHVDTPARDSLACDLMEPVRPQVDAFLLDWITREPLKRSWFFEQRDGNCRLMSTLAVELAQTAPMWGHAVAPLAEWVARTLWSSISKSRHAPCPPTRLTQRYKREAKGQPPLHPPIPAPRRKKLCPDCGMTIRSESFNCANCALGNRTHRFGDVARIGRELAHTPEARAKEGQQQRRHAQARSEWTPSRNPDWLTADVYRDRIQPRLVKLSNAVIASQIGVSRWYAWRIRKGYRPHPRLWDALAQLIRARPGT